MSHYLSSITCLTITHLVDFVDRERLCCTFTVRHQQFQAPIPIKVCGYRSWRFITVMMRLNTRGYIPHNIYYPHAGT